MADDIKDLTNEELEAAIVADGTPEKVEAPEPDVPTPDEPEEPEPVEDEAPEEDPEEEPAPPSRREQLRIQQVLEKLKQQPQAQPPKATGLDYGQELDASPELIKQLEADRQSAVNAAYEQNHEVMQTYRWETMVNLDNPQVEAKYPQLDKNSSEFHPALSDSIGQMYFQLSGVKPGPNGTYTVANPGMRYKDFVDSFFEVANEAASVKTAATTKNVAKQAAQTGLRPDGSKAKRLNLNQAPESMSDEELKAVIAQSGM